MGTPIGPHGGIGPAHIPGHSLDELFPGLSDEQAAIKRAFADKAAALGAGFTGAAVDSITTAPNGPDGAWYYYKRFENCTIYWTKRYGAFEVHGGIRGKYDLLGGLPVLGTPLTDESPCPDGRGRYNYFEKDVSIYWHPDAGPQMLSGSIRREWGNRGWENGPLGYPIRDQFATAHAQACLFQNGALSTEDGQTVMEAPIARMGHDRILTFVWEYFDRLVHQSPDNIGLHPHRSLNAVSSTVGATYRARNRALDITINGFRDNGLLLADTDWDANLVLVLRDSDHPGGGWNMVAELVHLNVVARGGYPDIAASVQRGVSDAVSDAFTSPVRLAAPADPARPTFPPDSDFIAAIVDPTGDLLLLFANTVPGRLAAVIAQRTLDDLEP